MNLPKRGSVVYVEGYGGAIYAGGANLQSDDASIMLKFEGRGLDEGYGNGIITIPLSEFTSNRVHPEQVPEGEPLVTSTAKRDAKLGSSDG